MKVSRRNLLILLCVWIVVVSLLFATLADKKIASVIAGTGFVILPILICLAEMQRGARDFFVLISAVVFFFFSALPIFLLRVLNWERDFKDLSILGISSEFLHKSSNFLYLLMLAAVALAFFRERKSKGSET